MFSIGPSRSSGTGANWLVSGAPRLPRQLFRGCRVANSGSFDQALAEAQRAVALDPNSADSYNALAFVLDYFGRPAEAVAAAEKAMRLDPQHRDQYLIWVGMAQTQLGHYSKAIPIVKKFQASYPNILGSGFCFTYLMVDYVELGQENEARAEAADLLRFSPDLTHNLLMERLPLKNQATANLFSADFSKAGLK
jgi:adenylate cyclase